MTLPERALAWANEILATRWSRGRFNLELHKESMRHARRLGRHIYRAEIRVWDLAGIVQVELGWSGKVLALTHPLGPDECEPLPAIDPEAAPAPAIQAALTRIRESCPDRLAVRSAALATRRDRSVVRISVEHNPPDGLIVIILDPGRGERLGYCCQPFFRGSRNSAALGKLSAVGRAEEVLDLPPEVRLARSELVKTARHRVWSFRWEVRSATQRGFVKAGLNARTGQLCEWYQNLHTPLRLDRRGLLPRDEAQRVMAELVRIRVGSGAELGSVVLGAVIHGSKPRAAWLAAVQDRRGRVMHVRLIGGRLDLGRWHKRGA